jgi:hypothetical protein
VITAFPPIVNACVEFGARGVAASTARVVRSRSLFRVLFVHYSAVWGSTVFHGLQRTRQKARETQVNKGRAVAKPGYRACLGGRRSLVRIQSARLIAEDLGIPEVFALTRSWFGRLQRDGNSQLNAALSRNLQVVWERA